MTKVAESWLHNETDLRKHPDHNSFYVVHFEHIEDLAQDMRAASLEVEIV